jgi:RNA polymerase sigma-70 factor (ECF subfamily)
MVESIADQEILKQCIADNKKAREEFVKRFSDPVYKWIQYTLKARNISFGQQDLEDLHNTVFMKLFERRCKKLRQYKGKNGCSVFSWIRLITVRIVIDHLRALRRDVLARRETIYVLENIPDLMRSELEPLALMEMSEQIDLLKQGLRSLMPRDRLFLKMHCLHGFSIQKVADILGISENNAYSVKHRAIRRLKTQIAKSARGRLQ